MRPDHDTAAVERKASPKLLSWGELLWDVFPDRPRLGGAAANLAYHAAQCGARAKLVSRVGQDKLGDDALAALAQAGVDVSLVQRDPEYPTGTVRVELHDGQPRFTIVDRVAWDRIAFSGALEAIVSELDVFCFSTLAQRTPTGSAALHAALAALRPECLRICDLNLRPPFTAHAAIDQSIARAQIVKLNDSEARFLERTFASENAVDWLLDRGVLLVALTLGAGGSALHTRSGSYECAAVPLSSSDGDPVGAGDAFTAVLAVQLARGAALETAARAANRYASYVASCRGGMPPVPSDVAGQ